MSVLSRPELEASPLADLHLIASELGVDGFRRLRKADLVDAIVSRQGGEDGAAAPVEAVEAEEDRPRRRRGGRGRGRARDEENGEAEQEVEAEAEADEAPAPSRRRRAGAADAEAEAPTPSRRRRAGAADAEAEAPAPRGRRAAAAADAEDEAPAPSRRRRAAAADAEDEAPAPSRRRRTAAADTDEETPAPRGRRAAAATDAEDEAPAPRGRRAAAAAEDEAPAPSRRRRAVATDDEDEAPAPSRRRRAAETADADEVAATRERRAAAPADESQVAEGVIEVLANGSGFLRVSPPDPSDEDVYVSAAQVRRCELVSGDRVTGPVRAPRRSERYPSLVRVDTINGGSADEVAEGAHFDDLPAGFPTERFTLGVGADDPTLKAVEWLTPLGRGSRVTIVGASRAGKTEALRRMAAALAGQDGLEVSVVLAGVRPEEVADWTPEPVAALTFAASADAQAQAVERAVDAAKRVAARGGHAALLIDTLEYLHAPAARKALAAARNIVGGGSLTVIATSSKQVGGETTVIALDAALAQTGRFPALDLVASGTLRPELLVGEAGADAIAQARAAAL